jgi:hypothetical protein
MVELGALGMLEVDFTTAAAPCTCRSAPPKSEPAARRHLCEWGARKTIGQGCAKRLAYGQRGSHRSTRSASKLQFPRRHNQARC